MPADFDKCRAMGGKIRTKDLGENKYMPICYKDGKSFAGEVKEKKKK
jgi:hypothetical protein